MRRGKPAAPPPQITAVLPEYRSEAEMLALAFKAVLARERGWGGGLSLQHHEALIADLENLIARWQGMLDGLQVGRVLEAGVARQRRSAAASKPPSIAELHVFKREDAAAGRSARGWLRRAAQHFSKLYADVEYERLQEKWKQRPK